MQRGPRGRNHSAESGVPGFDASTVTALLAPSRTPRDIVARLNTALNQVLDQSAVKERFAGVGAEVQPGTSEELAAWIKEDLQMGKGSETSMLLPSRS